MRDMRIPFDSAGAPPRPSKIVAIGRNYREHAKELGNVAPDEAPLLFLKAPSALVYGGGDIVLPPESQRVDYEGELALVIGRRTKNCRPEEWLDALAGICCANDVTARDLQKKDGQWARAKSFDTFCPVGPEIVGGVDPSDLAIQTRVNGETVQDGNTRDMIFGIGDLLSRISRTLTLEPGDVIATGTPEGVGYVRTPPWFLTPGDVVEVEIDHLGVLRTPIVGSAERP